MIIISPKHRIFIATQPIDFRKGLFMIASVCQQQFEQDPMSGHYFIFSNRRRTDIKILYYSGMGFCLWHTRLSRGRFNHWPKVDSPLLTLTPEQFYVLIGNGNPAGANTQVSASDR